MRTHSVLLNSRCNLACTFCTIRRAEDDPRAIAHAAVKRRIGDAGEAHELVLTGGEPTMRGDLAALIRHAKTAGVRSVVLETNGTLLDVARATELREAGLDAVRLHVPALGATLAAITRDDDAPAALERGLAAIRAAGLALDVAIPIVRANLAEVGELPRALGSVRTIILRVPTQSPDSRELVSYAEAAVAITTLVSTARELGIATKLAPDSGPPPCVFPSARRPSHLYSLSGRPPPRDDHTHVAACAACRVRDECPGIDRAHLARFGEPALEPITEDRARRRLALVSTVDEQIARELVQPGGRPQSPGDPEERIIRVNFHCNQACDFCFVSTHLPPAHEDVVRRAIEDALASGHRIVLSGGEPTLNGRLADYLRLATTSPWPVQLQTNAVRLEDAALARRLYEAGLRTAFVSLHGVTAASSDAITRAPGTFEKTLRGLDNLHTLGTQIDLNFVICRSNAHELPRLVELVADRWPGATLTVSFVARSTDVVPRERDFVPRYSEVVPFIAEALALGRARGVTVHGFDSMCGVPLCVVPVPSAEHFALPELFADDGDGEFEKPLPCTGCGLASRCFGIRRGYVELHGFDELRPV